MALLNAHYVFPALPISHSSAELQGAVATIRVSLNRQHPSPVVREGIPNATGPPMPAVRAGSGTYNVLGSRKRWTTEEECRLCRLSVRALPCNLCFAGREAAAGGHVERRKELEENSRNCDESDADAVLAAVAKCSEP